MKYLTLILLIVSVCIYAEENSSKKYNKIESKHWTTTDHSKHEALKKKFTSGEEITKACISCHSDAADQVHKTIHWRWQVPSDPKMGKAGYSINNFCISANRFKDKSCNDCHPSWQGKNVEGTVNCLVCHSNSTMNFNEALVNIREFSQEGDEESMEMVAEIQGEISDAIAGVGLPTRKNCGSCHFYGGGGDGVKHGDLDSSLNDPDRSLDVHMSPKGGNFSCTRCHTAQEHRIAGRMYTIPAADKKVSLLEDDQTSKITCVSCHGSVPHHESKINDHTDKVSCQACHIPYLARKKPTKISWDWAEAGKKKDGKPYREKDELGKYSYLSHKGKMKWAKNVEPEYFWFNGSISGVLAGEKIDPNTVTWVAKPQGSREDGNSLIFPFKVHRGNQPYDMVHNTLLTPLLSGKSGYWGLLEWDKPLRDGAEAMGLPYSGKYGFTRTNYVYPSTHMVAPKENALRCIDCHGDNSRLKNLTGFYMPARDRIEIIDLIAWALVVMTLFGVFGHAALRFISYRKRNSKDQ